MHPVGRAAFAFSALGQYSSVTSRLFSSSLSVCCLAPRLRSLTCSSCVAHPVLRTPCSGTELGTRVRWLRYRNRHVVLSRSTRTVIRPLFARRRRPSRSSHSRALASATGRLPHSLVPVATREVALPPPSLHEVAFLIRYARGRLASSRPLSSGPACESPALVGLRVLPLSRGGEASPRSSCIEGVDWKRGINLRNYLTGTRYYCQLRTSLVGSSWGLSPPAPPLSLADF